MSLTRIAFDSGPLKNGTAFEHPVQIIEAREAHEVPQAFARMQQAQAGGYWLAGFASYELGYVFSKKLQGLMPQNRRLPLLLFGVFKQPEALPARMQNPQADLTGFAADWDITQYKQAFEQVKAYIGAGDIYQANLTFGLTARFSGSPEALYERLRQKQPAPHGAFVDLGDMHLLSRSPELFFEIDAENRITAKPMKGTVARGASAQEDHARMDWLRSSVKNQAENLMIVDLMRNDISRISRMGSVKVPDLFSIETYATLHQMTSRITADLVEGLSLYDIFAALFPCGSITGAPKIRAMQILAELEPDPREAYCGAIGWIAPDGRMLMNVAIRTLMCSGTKARLNAGGGLVYDSVAREEYNEALLKTEFAHFGQA